MSIIAENRINKIYQYIESGPYTIEFNLEFGKGIDSTVNPNDSRMDYTTANKFLIDEVYLMMVLKTIVSLELKHLSFLGFLI